MDNKQKQVEKHIKGMQKHNRKQNLRAARRKNCSRNRDRKPRQKKISPTNWDHWDDLDEVTIDTFEPIVSHNSRERRREISKQAIADDSSSDTRQVADPNRVSYPRESSDTTQGLVIEAVSGMCRVDLNDDILLCDIRGNVKDAQTGYINAVAVGDRVIITKNGFGGGVVEAVLPRRSVLSRPYSPDVGKTIEDLEQIVVANVDRLLIVASWREPFVWPGIIDRYLIAAQRNNIETAICINKTDLVEDQVEFNAIIKVYQELGYPLILTSAVSKAGIDELKALLKDCITALAGLSGVGKSTLLTAVQPSLNLKTGQVSEHGLFTGQGRHTTTQSSLLKLDMGGVVVDTPGVRSFAVAGINPLDLAGWYPEMLPYINDCRFGNCTHINEPGCGILTAIQNGNISQLRYKNYTQIFEELSTLS
jgi:ribosome biogenesis GTPase